MRTKHVLLGAAKLIEKLGHCKKANKGPLGEMCMREAISVAAGKESLEFPAVLALRRANASVAELGVIAWNDRAETTQADVIHLLRSTAEKLP